MDFDKLVYQDIAIIDDIEYKCSINIKTNEIKIPYTDELYIGIDDIIKIKLGKRENTYKIVNCKFVKGGTLNVGTEHPHMLTLIVKDNSKQEDNLITSNTTYNINSISGEQFQIGNNNTQTINITLQELVEKISKTNDNEAKSLLKKIFENSTISSILGAGASVLFEKL